MRPSAIQKCGARQPGAGGFREAAHGVEGGAYIGHHDGRATVVVAVQPGAAELLHVQVVGLLANQCAGGFALCVQSRFDVGRLWRGAP